MSLGIATALVLFFGYIIPQAVCTGPDQIAICSFFSGFTRVLFFVILVFNNNYISNMLSRRKTT